MSVTDKTERSQTESVTFEFDLPHAPEKVWRAITDPELLGQWLLPVTGFDLRPMTEFTFRAPPQPGWDGIVNCRMLEVDRHQKVSWSWVVGDIDTILTITLTPTASGTRVDLVQSGFKPHQKQNLGGARYGWRMMGGKLVEVLAGMP